MNSKFLTSIFVLLLINISLPAQTLRVGLPYSFDMNKGASINGLKVEDMDVDGNKDIVVKVVNGVQVLWGNADGHSITVRFTININKPFSWIGLGVYDIDLSDYNGDHKPDIAIYSDSMYLYFNNGDRTFSKLNSHKGQPFPVNLHVDFNNDGNPDYVSAGPTSVNILINHGSTAETITINTPNKAESDPYENVQLTVDDFNDDNKEDVIFIGHSKYYNHLILIAGNGDGTFAAPIVKDLTNFPQCMVTGDFNRDGHLDIAIGNAFYNVDIFTGSGNGTFSRAMYYTKSGGVMTANDFNGDDYLDLAVTDLGSGTVTVLMNNGGKDFNTMYHYTATVNSTAIVSTDFDNNGSIDLLIGNFSSNDIYLMTGNGDGQFRAAENYTVPPDTHSSESADFNMDGAPDILVTGTYGNVATLFLNNQDGTFSTRSIVTDGSPNNIARIDLNSDQKQDIVIRTYGGVGVLLNNGSGFANPVLFQVDKNGFASTSAGFMRVADLNGDGKDDLVTRNYNNIPVLLNTGGALTLHGTAGLWRDVKGLDVGDFDNDSKIDLVVSDGDSLHVMKGSGGGDFKTVWRYSINGSEDLRSHDVNGDGNPDLINVADTTLTILAGNGNGSFTFLAKYYLGDEVSGNWSVQKSLITIKNLNGDSHDDIIVGTKNHIVFLLGKSGGAFENPLRFPIAAPAGISVADFNQDGNLEVVTLGLGMSIIKTEQGNGNPSCTLPMPSANNVTICVNTNTTLKASGSVFYNWYTKKLGGSALSHSAEFLTPVLTKSDTFYVSIFSGTCESKRRPVIVTVITVPQKPSLPEGDTLVCLPRDFVTYQVKPQPITDNYLWIVSQGVGGTDDLPLHFLENGGNVTKLGWDGRGYMNVLITVTAINKCGSTTSNALPVEVNYIPFQLEKMLGGGPPEICNNDGIPTDCQTPERPGVKSYVWSTDPPNAGVANGTTNPTYIEWSRAFTGNVNITVVGKNGCGTGTTPSPPYTLKLIGPTEAYPVPMGDTVICDASVNTVYTSVDPPNPPHDILWYHWMLEPSYAGDLLNIEDGKSVSIHWNASFTGKAALVVSAINNCGGDVSKPLMISTGAPLTSVAAYTPAGETIVCNTKPGNYTVPPRDDVKKYAWHIDPPIAGEITGNGNAIEITWEEAFSGDVKISVSEQGNCNSVNNSEALSVNVKPLPAKPASIFGDSIVCDYNGGLPYAVGNPSTELDYKWKIDPPDAGLIAPDNKTSLTVIWSKDFRGTATIMTTAWNDCGSSEATALLVELTVCTGIENFEPSTIKVYPNPSQGNFTLNVGQMFSAEAFFEVIDINAKVVKAGVLHERQDYVTLSNAKGLYTIKITDGKRSVYKRVLVE